MYASDALLNQAVLDHDPSLCQVATGFPKHQTLLATILDGARGELTGVFDVTSYDGQPPGHSQAMPARLGVAKRLGIAKRCSNIGATSIAIAHHELIEALVSSFEDAKVELTSSDFDRGYIEIPIEYARGEPPKAFPATIQLVRPGAKLAAKLIVELLTDEDYEKVALSCIQPPKLATQEAEIRTWCYWPHEKRPCVTFFGGVQPITLSGRRIA